MLWFGGHFMLVYLEEGWYVSRHQNVDSACVVVPMQFDAAVEIPRSIFGKFIFFLYAFDKVINVLLVHIFNPKIINYQCEGDRADKMSP